MSHPATRRDAGFALIELLAALSLAAMLIVAVGGLVSICVEARRRSENTAVVEAALIDLRPILEVSSHFAGGKLVALSDGRGVRLEEGARSGELTLRDQKRMRAATEGGSAVDVNLAAFDDMWLEYLVNVGGERRWRRSAASEGNLGVRLLMTQHPRVWRVLLWITAAPAHSGDPTASGL